MEFVLKSHLSGIFQRFSCYLIDSWIRTWLVSNRPEIDIILDDLNIKWGKYFFSCIFMIKIRLNSRRPSETSFEGNKTRHVK